MYFPEESEFLFINKSVLFLCFPEKIKKNKNKSVLFLYFPENNLYFLN